MDMPEGWVDRSLAEFARAVAAPDPLPGSGSVAAALGALGAGLASMALGSTRGEGPVAAAARAAAAELAGAMEALLADVDRDARAYGEYQAARRMQPGGSPEAARERAIAVPCAVAAQALAALERLAGAWSGVRPRLASEGFTAAQALLASVEGAVCVAQTNLAEAGERSARASELEARRARARELAREIACRVREAS